MSEMEKLYKAYGHESMKKERDFFEKELLSLLKKQQRY